MKTTKEIIKDFTGKSDISIEQFMYDIARDSYALEKDQYQRWFSEEEVNDIYQRLLYRIFVCSNPFKKEDLKEMFDKDLGVGQK